MEAKYDANKLYILIKDNKTAPEIMDELNIKSLATLKNHMFRLMNEKKEFLAIKGMSSRARSTRPAYKKNKIIITDNMLAGIKFDEGQKFTLEETSEGLLLKKN